MINLISDISALGLTIFGIGVTIFTVIYSFIINKKEYLNSLAPRILNGDACPELISRYKITQRYIEKQKFINVYMIILSILSLLTYISSMIYKYVSNPYWLGILCICLASILIIYLLFIVIYFILNYFKTTKV